MYMFEVDRKFSGRGLPPNHLLGRMSPMCPFLGSETERGYDSSTLGTFFGTFRGVNNNLSSFLENDRENEEEMHKSGMVAANSMILSHWG